MELHQIQFTLEFGLYFLEIYIESGEVIIGEDFHIRHSKRFICIVDGHEAGYQAEEVALALVNLEYHFIGVASKLVL